MRIAQRTISRNYLTYLNNTLSKRADILENSEDGLRFRKLSEDVAAGARAMDTQESRYAALQQKNTADELLKEMESAWTSLGTSDSIIQDVLEKMKEAAGVRPTEKLETIKKEIGEMKAQYLQQLNAQYGGKYLFGGTNNASPPFTENEDGRLLFNGVEVSKIYKANGKFYVSQDGQTKDPDNDSVVPQSGAIYLDVGMGLQVGGEGVDPRTAFQVNVIGLEAVGFMDFTPDIPTTLGEHQNEDDRAEWISKTNNIYDLISEVEDLLAPGYAEEKLDDMQLRLTKMNDTMRMARTEVDTRANSLEYTINRLSSDIDGMEKLEDSLMTAEPAGEAIKMKDVEYAWRAVLALGNQILPSSLLDYLR